MRFRFRIVLLLACLTGFAGSLAAQVATLKGRVTDEYNRPIEDIQVRVASEGVETKTDSSGRFQLKLQPGKYFVDLVHPDYRDSRETVTLAPSETKRIFVKMLDAYKLETTEITDEKDPTDLEDPDRAFTRLIPIDPKRVSEIPSVKSDLSNRIATLAVGVTSNNELSSQYRVRGGNFDENLIYVNDIEVYRPFLIRTGQQEGLGFVNPNLAAQVGFSSGGFQAKYGDKLSSTLDVVFSDPEDFHGSAELGILSQNVHLEGSVIRAKEGREEEQTVEGETVEMRPGRFTYLVGARRFTPSYVLGSLDTKGEYKPQFHDLQGMLTFQPRHRVKEMRIRERNGQQDTTIYNRDRLKFSLLFNVANNNYVFTPQSRETSFGTIQQALRLRVAFVGQDLSGYTTGLTAFTVEHRPNVRLKIKHIFTAFRTVESELFDIEGGYWLSDVNTNFGSEGYNDVVFDRGIGTFYRHGRNYLTASVYSAEQRGDWYPDKALRHKVSWGMRFQQQVIDDQLKEWTGTDSSGYFTLDESFRSTVNLESYLVKGYVQDHWKLSKDKTKRLVVGARAVYNSLNSEFFVAPRVQFIIDPASKGNVRGLLDEGSEFAMSDRRKYQLRFAAGAYQQPLFYREMRDFDGTVYTDRESQKSYHLIAGGDYLFRIWKRPFKLTAEAYYKYLDDLVPYEVENVRIRYYPQETATGYAVGLDARVTGEFIKGVDSWMTLGILKTQEKVESLDQGYVSRPTDQRLNFSMFFQDELPHNPTYKVNINFVYGSGLRYGFPRKLESRTVFSIPSYQRVDLGFSKMVLFNTPEELEDKKFGIQSMWVSAEIFNLFQRANTVSYIWIQDIYNTQFSVPNFLSARLLNLRLMVRF